VNFGEQYHISTVKTSESAVASLDASGAACQADHAGPPRNLRRAASRFNELGRPEVAAYLEERAREETGHWSEAGIDADWCRISTYRPGR
jgi:hypothetical protein